MSLSRGRHFVISLCVTSVGIGLGGYGGRVMIDRMSGVGLETRLDPSGIAIFAAGAVCFAFGVMWLLTALVRPFFEKRAVDRYVEEWTERQRPH